MLYANIIRAVLARPWAIDPDSLAWAAICDVLALRASGQMLTEADIEARIAAAQRGPRTGGKRTAQVAVIPIYGVITPRASMLGRTSGGTTAEDIGAEFAAVASDPEISGIVLDIDSPGGNVEGIAEVAAAIRAVRGTKPIVAQANHLAASAAYWLASAADEIVVTPSGSVGSIGVVSAHQDISEAMAREGIKTTIVSAGKFKAEGNKFEPLGDEARAAIQADADAFYGMFTGDVAKGRGIGVDTVRGAYGQGRVLLAKNALAAGMVDRIDTLEATIQRVGRGAVEPRALSAPSGAAAIGETHYLSTVPSGVEDADPADDAPADPPAEPVETTGAPPVDPEPGEAPPDASASTPRVRHDLELQEAAFAGGHGWII